MDLWEGLKTTFRAFSNEDDAARLGVYPYNGFLFDQARTPLTSGARLPNLHLTQAIESLTTVQTGKVRMHIDYRNLGVEELGAVYESLLDYTLSIASITTVVDGHTVRPGEAYLAPLSIERSDLASYFTPADLVDLFLERSLDPLLEATLAKAGHESDDQVQALLELRVMDPACGSAAILIGALDRIAYAVAKARTSLKSRAIPTWHTPAARCCNGASTARKRIPSLSNSPKWRCGSIVLFQMSRLRSLTTTSCVATASSAGPCSTCLPTSRTRHTTCRNAQGRGTHDADQGAAS